MGWVSPHMCRPAIKVLVLANYLIVGQVAQFKNWAYSAKQNKRHPRSPSDTKPPTFEISISSSMSPTTVITMDVQLALNKIHHQIDRSPPHLNTQFHTATHRAACAPQVPLNDMWGHLEVATLTTMWVEELEQELHAIEIGNEEFKYGKHFWLIHLCHDCGSPWCQK